METDKVIMGSRKDSLHDMIKFSGNEGEIVWPLWKNDLMERIKYELGKKAVQIVEGELKKDNIRRRALYDSVQQVAEMLAPKNRTGVQTNGSWIEVQKTKLGKRVTRLSMIGECAIRGAIEKLKRSYFDSILEYGLAEGSKYYVEFKKLKENYDENTLPEWIEKMDWHEGVNLNAVYGAYVEQMTALRVIKVSESASILRNVLRRDDEDVLSGFECFYDTKHTIAQLKEGIDDVKKKIKVLREGSVQTSHPPECIGAGVIVPNLIRELAFVPEYKDPIKEYGQPAHAVARHPEHRECGHRSQHPRA